MYTTTETRSNNEMNAEQIQEEFEILNKLHRHHSFDTSTAFKYMTRNRYKDVLAVEHSRVKLNNKTSDYMNANWVPMMTCTTSNAVPENGADGESDKYFINTQAPTPHTTKHFWSMVWDQRISLVVMLTQELEDGRKKADRYWPQQPGLEEHYGDYTVHLSQQYSALNAACTIRVLTLRHSAHSDQSRVVYHVQYLTWPDRGVPADCLSFLRLLDMTRLLHQKLRGPLCVMCSAGIGRTGTFTALYALMLHAISARHCCSIAKLVHHLRIYRPGSVQTLAQYQFIYQAAHWLQQIYCPLRATEKTAEPITEHVLVR
jgi:protein tyrosine phosphatase